MGNVRRDSEKYESFDSTSLSASSESGAPMNSRNFTSQESKAKSQQRGKVIADGLRCCCCAVAFLPFSRPAAATPGLVWGVGRGPAWRRQRSVGPGPARRRQRKPPGCKRRQRRRRGAPETRDVRGPPPVLVPCRRLRHNCRPRGSAWSARPCSNSGAIGILGIAPSMIYIPSDLDSNSGRDQSLPSPPTEGQ